MLRAAAKDSLTEIIFQESVNKISHVAYVDLNKFEIVIRLFQNIVSVFRGFSHPCSAVSWSLNLENKETSLFLRLSSANPTSA